MILRLPQGQWAVLCTNVPGELAEGQPPVFRGVWVPAKAFGTQAKAIVREQHRRRAALDRARRLERDASGEGIKFTVQSEPKPLCINQAPRMRIRRMRARGSSEVSSELVCTAVPRAWGLTKVKSSRLVSSNLGDFAPLHLYYQRQFRFNTNVLNNVILVIMNTALPSASSGGAALELTPIYRPQSLRAHSRSTFLRPRIRPVDWVRTPIS
jgi:hypothetical protein